MKIVIVGAGIAGLAIGWRLAQSGCSVEILERGVAGRGATWASAGMLAPGAEMNGEDGALAHFARQGRGLWPAFAVELEAASGHDIGFREAGSLILAQDDARARSVMQRASLANAAWLTPAELRAREPLLSHAIHGALYVGEDAHVDNRALGPALAAALARSGVSLREHCHVEALAIANGRVQGVVTPSGSVKGDIVILACGAWLNAIGGIDSGDLPAIKPAKGQMVALEPPSGTILPHALIWTEDAYLVPRRGRLLVGATLEDAGFDTSVTRTARDTLMNAAARVIPACSGWRVAEIWAGLRPRSADDAPVIGSTGISGLYVAGGQFRNGILFAPAIADAMRQLVLGEPKGTDIAAFDPNRFAHP